MRLITIKLQAIIDGRISMLILKATLLLDKRCQPSSTTTSCGTNTNSNIGLHNNL